MTARSARFLRDFGLKCHLHVFLLNFGFFLGIKSLFSMRWDVFCLEEFFCNLNPIRVFRKISDYSRQDLEILFKKIVWYLSIVGQISMIKSKFSKVGPNFGCFPYQVTILEHILTKIAQTFTAWNILHFRKKLQYLFFQGTKIATYRCLQFLHIGLTNIFSVLVKEWRLSCF